MIKIGARCSVVINPPCPRKRRRLAMRRSIRRRKAVRTIRTDGSEIPNNHPKDVSQTPMNSGTFTILTGEWIPDFWLPSTDMSSFFVFLRGRPTDGSEDSQTWKQWTWKIVGSERTDFIFMSNHNPQNHHFCHKNHHNQNPYPHNPHNSNPYTQHFIPTSSSSKVLFMKPVSAPARSSKHWSRSQMVHLWFSNVWENRASVDAQCWKSGKFVEWVEIGSGKFFFLWFFGRCGSVWWHAIAWKVSPPTEKG